MFSYLLKPLFGLLTVGGLGTGSYFLYKHTTSKKEEVSQEGGDSEVNSQGSGSRQGASGVPTTTTTGSGGVSGGEIVTTGEGIPGNGTQGGDNGAG